MKSKKDADSRRATTAGTPASTSGRECYHCKQWVEPEEPHNCWTTTEAALTAELSEDLRDAWERLRETAAAFGDQRIYASLNSIMFSRTACYCFVRPKTKYLEVCVFLGRTVKAPQIQRAIAASRVKVAHLVRIRHRDEVEAPLTDWMREAYEMSDALSGRVAAQSGGRAPGSAASKPKRASAPSRRKKRSTPSPARARPKRG